MAPRNESRIIEKRRVLVNVCDGKDMGRNPQFHAIFFLGRKIFVIYTAGMGLFIVQENGWEILLSSKTCTRQLLATP